MGPSWDQRGEIIKALNCVGSDSIWVFKQFQPGFCCSHCCPMALVPTWGCCHLQKAPALPRGPNSSACGGEICAEWDGGCLSWLPPAQGEAPRGTTQSCCWSISTVQHSRGQKQLLCVLLGGNNSVQHGRTLNCTRRERVGTCSHSHNCFQCLVQTQRRCCCGPQAQGGWEEQELGQSAPGLHCSQGVAEVQVSASSDFLVSIASWGTSDQQLLCSGC